jgi:hypothetical protein
MEALLLGHTKKPPEPGLRWQIKPAPDAVGRGFWRGGNPLQLAWGGKLGLAPLNKRVGTMNRISHWRHLGHIANDNDVTKL